MRSDAATCHIEQTPTFTLSDGVPVRLSENRSDEKLTAREALAGNHFASSKGVENTLAPLADGPVGEAAHAADAGPAARGALFRPTAAAAALAAARHTQAAVRALGEAD